MDRYRYNTWRLMRRYRVHVELDPCHGPHATRGGMDRGRAARGVGGQVKAQTEAGTRVRLIKGMPYCTACYERVIPAPANHPWPYLHRKCAKRG